MKRKNVYIAHSARETQKIAKDFAKQLQGGDVVALSGDLGSGKTTFAQGLAKGLGITRRIISPTFVMMRSYKFKIQNSKFKTIAQSEKLFYHIDLYRTETLDDIKGLGLEEIISDQKNIVVIEWAQKMKGLLPQKRWELFFSYINDKKRQINIVKKNN